MTLNRTRALVKPGLGAVLVTALVVFGFPGVAGAHHPEIVAEADCDAFLIRYTATAWVGTVPDSRINNDVRIALDGVEVDSGQFNAANNYTFSGVIPATPGTHIIRATAVVQWGAAQDRGDAGVWREWTVVVPENCVPPTSSTVPTSTVPTSTVPIGNVPTTTAAPTPTVPTEVEGEIEISEPAQPLPGQPQFTG
jgi:hypothetical protein